MTPISRGFGGHRWKKQRCSNAGRAAPGKMIVQERELSEEERKRMKAAAEQPGHDDATVFGDLLATQDLVFDFPLTGWLFRPDPHNQGVADRWFAKHLCHCLSPRAG